MAEYTNGPSTQATFLPEDQAREKYPACPSAPGSQPGGYGRGAPIFTRRHYESIAATLKARHPKGPYPADWFGIVRELADAFQADNPRFDRGRFMVACGMSDPARPLPSPGKIRPESACRPP
jgi:hypothetical protein